MPRKAQRNKSESQQQQSQQDDFSQSPRRQTQQAPSSSLLQKNQRARRGNVIPRNYQNDYSDADQMKEQESQGEYIYFKGGRVHKILAERKRSGTNVIERLCKFYSKSYLHVQWLTDEEVKQRNIQMNRQSRTSIQSALKHLTQIQQKFGEDKFFNPSFTRVDRILTTAVLFPLMHHKKGSQMNGKWSEMMMLVCSKILNFEKNHIPYGVIQKDDYHPEYIEEVKLQNKVKIQHVINRVYLDKYQTPQQFWKDVGESIRSLVKGYAHTGRQQDALLLRQCVVFLYWQWFFLSKQRFLSFLPNEGIYDRVRKDLQNQTFVTNFTFSQQSETSFNFKQMLKQNIFIRNYGQKPSSQKQLLLLHPGRFSYAWLSTFEDSTDYSNIKFEHINEQDIKKLDLNVQIDNLYLIKWCDLDYDQVSWEKQSDLNCFEKIANFKQYSKIPPKKDRQRIEQNKKYHKIMLNSMQQKSKQSAQTVQKCKRRLYHLHQSGKQIKQYNDSDRPVYKDYKVLKNFQLEGLNWLIKSWHERRNCILADQMGLGKTIQTIAFLNHLQVYQGILGPFLVVAPVSTLKQWRNQIQHWSDLNCVLYKGKMQVRDLIQQYQFYHKFVTNEGIFVKYQKLPRFQVLLTNYEIFVSDIEMFQKLAFQHIIMDEAHKMKNSKSKIATTLKMLPCPRILLLTGTPIQNNTSEIFGLLNIIEPRKFNSLEAFKEKFGCLKTVQQLAQLKQVLKPYMMRRVKSDVQKSIPKLSQMLVTLQLTKIQKAFYRSILQKNKNQLLSSLSSTAIHNISQCLRQCCNHPYMLSHEVQDQLTLGLQTEQQKLDKFIMCSSKMIFVHKFITKCKQNRSKTLIFTQYLDMMKLLKQYCSSQKVQFQMLDGSVNYQARQNRIDRFNTNPDVLVFIISTKAGGIGINLTSATNIIIYDSDWNPQNDIQAIARAHRIGQHKNVSVYRLITTQTYEDILYKTAVKKLGIGLAILDNQYFNNQVNVPDPKKQKSKQQIEKLLRDGVLGFLKSQENMNKEQKNIENQSIQDIISKSCSVIDYQTKDCSFTSTKFEYESTGEKNIKLDDPNFWQVALENVQSPLQKLVKKLKNDQQTKKIFQSFEQQLKLMVQANQVVFNFVKSKISMSHFNAQDERELRNFLQKITYARQFHKEYKSIANDWLEQIEKPSRRFQKYDINKLAQIIKSKIDLPHPPARIIRNRSKKVDPNAQQMQQQQKSSIKMKRVSTRKSRTIESSQNDQDEEKQDDQKQSNSMNSQNEQQKIQEQDYKDNKNTKKNKSKKDKSNKNIGQEQEDGGQDQEKKARICRKLPKDPSLFEKQISQNLGYYLDKICCFCERKLCSKLCKGRCKRTFHQVCYERFKNKSQQIPTISQIQQLKQTKDELSKQLSSIFKCDECVLGNATCFLCGNKGKVMPSAWVEKGAPKKPLRLSQNPASRNQIDGIFAAASEQQKRIVHQCRMEYCTKAYHLKCLKQTKNELQFQMYANKQEESYPIKCPCHFCAICRQKLSYAKISCLRCPVSYHVKCKGVRSNAMYELDNQSFICKIHMSDQQLQRRKFEKNDMKSSKKSKIEDKKFEKEVSNIKSSIQDDQIIENANNSTSEVKEKVSKAFKQIEKNGHKTK